MGRAEPILMIRLIAMLAVYTVGCVPGWRVYQELRLVYDALWVMHDHYTFQQEMLVRGHI